MKDIEEKINENEIAEGELSDDAAETAAGGGVPPRRASADRISYRCGSCGKRYNQTEALNHRFRCGECKGKLVKDGFS